MAQFKDLRSSIDADYGMPVGRLVTATVGGHLSHEKDYDSRGVNGSVAVDLLQRLFTVTVGGSRNHDTSSPIGGTHVPLTDGSTLLSTSPQAKDVNSLMFGLSHVMTRRWLLGVSWSRTWEHGALTEPYKVLSVVDGEGTPVSILTEKRPDSRARRSIQVNSVQNIAGDVTRVSYRDYRDDWGVHSGTFDLEYRHDLDEKSWFEPHVRYYKQTAASFFTWGMVEGHRLPAYASSDYRLGPLRTLTLGATYGFHLFDDPGSMYVRAEYISQYGDGKPSGAIGIQQQYDLFPKLDIGSVVVGYAIDF